MFQFRSVTPCYDDGIPYVAPFSGEPLLMYILRRADAVESWSKSQTKNPQSITEKDIAQLQDDVVRYYGGWHDYNDLYHFKIEDLRAYVKSVVKQEYGLGKHIFVSEALEKRLSDNIDASCARILSENHPVDYNDEMIANIQLAELLGYDTLEMVRKYENELLNDVEYTAEYFMKLARPLEEYEVFGDDFILKLTEIQNGLRGFLTF